MFAEGEAWFGLAEEGGEAGWQGTLLVAGGNDDRECELGWFGSM